MNLEIGRILQAAHDAAQTTTGPWRREAFRIRRALIHAAHVLGETWVELGQMLGVRPASASTLGAIDGVISIAQFAVLVGEKPTVMLSSLVPTASSIDDEFSAVDLLATHLAVAREQQLDGNDASTS